MQNISGFQHNAGFNHMNTCRAVTPISSLMTRPHPQGRGSGYTSPISWASGSTEAL